MSEPAAPVDDRLCACLREATEWRLLGRLFECPTREWREEIEALARDLRSPVFEELVARARQEAREGLFHGILGPGGPAPAREVSYHDRLELGTLMADLTSQYEAFGYRPLTPETPDHVAVELGFVAYLALKEAYALAAGADEEAAVTRRTADRFRREHLAMMAGPLARLLAGSGVTYLARAATMLLERVGPCPGAGRFLPVVPADADEDDGSGFTCGA